MSNKPIKNEKFLQDQVNKLQIELTKFIIDTNYSNSYSLSLRQKLSSFESKLQKQIQTQRKANTQKVKQISTYLPQILSTVHPNIIQAPNSLYNIKTRTSNQIMSITKQIPKVEEDKKDDLFRPVKSSPKAFSVGKFIKYSSERKGQSLYHSRIYDTQNYPIIRNKEMKQGLLDLINQGLIPKIADLSPAFQKNGNPVNISSKSVKLNYTKQHSRDEVPDSPSKINSIKYDIKEEFIPEEKLLEKKKKSNLFLTANNESKTSEELHSIFFGSMDSGNNAYQVQSNSAEDIKEDKNDYYLNLTNETDDKDKLLITFNNFTLIKNEPYSKFVRANKAIKNKILFMVDNISSMLKKLDLKGRTKTNIINIIYVFPDNIHVSQEAINLIRRILVKDPHSRPTIEEIKNSDFFNGGINIPKTLPTSTLTTPLSDDEIKSVILNARAENETMDQYNLYSKQSFGNSDKKHGTKNKKHKFDLSNDDE